MKYLNRRRELFLTDCESFGWIQTWQGIWIMERLIIWYWMLWWELLKLKVGLSGKVGNKT